jgi:hypothetical protein
MAKPIKMSATLPDGEGNGLDALAPEMRRPDTAGVKYAVVAVITRQDLKISDYTGEVIPTARFLQLEVVTGEDVEHFAVLLRRAHDTRMGRDQLPLAMELDIGQIFKNFTDDRSDGDGGGDAADSPGS